MGFIVEILLLCLSLLLILGVSIVSVRELYINYYNPLPKFENGDKRLDQIHFVKTRKITDTIQRGHNND